MLITSSSSSSRTLSLFCSPSSSLSLKFNTLSSVSASFSHVNVTAIPKLGARRRLRRWRVKAGDNQSVKVASSPASTNVVVVADDDNVVDSSAAGVVRNFYGGINAHDLDSVQDLIAENCVYEDLVFPRPFVGRKEIIEFFRKFTNSTSTDLQFVIDDLSTQDSSSVGVLWHLEWKGKPFPFSKGCSFYRLEVINGKRLITYGRDCVEPAIKPGDAVLGAIKSVTWLLQQFPQLASRF